MKYYTKLLDLSPPSYMKYELFGPSLHKKYRGHFEIIALVLEAAKDNGATRFSIMTHANTNYRQLKKYLSSLTEIGFIEIDKKEGQCIYRASEKGLDFLRQYYVLLGMLLSALEKNKSANVIYEAEYNATSRQQHSAAQIVTSLRHNPT